MAYLVAEEADGEVICRVQLMDSFGWLRKVALAVWEARCAWLGPSTAISTRHHFSHINTVNLNCLSH